MKKLIYILGLILQVAPLLVLGQTAVMSFNIRYDNPDDKENRWDNRKLEIVNMIGHYSPEIMGIQEGLNNQVMYLDSALADYNYVGVGREDGKLQGEYAAIFYQKSNFKLLTTKTYWLSKTPDSVSVGWDASLERVVTFCEFLDIKTKTKLFVFNGHFDHIGEISKEKSAELILEILSKRGLKKERVIVMGDFNCEPDDKPIQIFQKKLNDAYLLSQVKPDGPIGTFNDFDLEASIEKRIDYILTRNIKVFQYENIDDRRTNNLYLSDHLPVLIKIE